MKLEITAVIPPGETRAFHGEIDPTDWQTEPEGAALLEKPHIDGTATRDGRRVYIEGELHVYGRYTCTRCLAESTHRRALPFAEAYSVDPTDPDAIPYDGTSIDMDALARDILIMAQGDRILCRDDCAGLCPGCGANLNHESCQCEPEDIPPQWAAWHELLTTKD